MESQKEASMVISEVCVKIQLSNIHTVSTNVIELHLKTLIEFDSAHIVLYLPRKQLDHQCTVRYKEREQQHLPSLGLKKGTYSTRQR